MRIYKLLFIAICIPFFAVSQESKVSIENDKPLFAGCEEMQDVTAQNKCTSKKIRQFFRKNLDKQILSDLNLDGKQTIYIDFNVAEDGSVKDFQVRSIHKELAEDFKRIAKLLPNFIPMTKDNVPISSKIAMSVAFLSKAKLSSKTGHKKEDVPFAVIEKVPVYPGCGKEKGNQAQKKCMSKKIAEYVNKRFNTGIAADLGLEGRQRINVIFKISKTGEIIDVRARAPHPDLKKEIIRVVSKLPKMEPGYQDGKTVNVPYSLPVVFMARKKVVKDPFDDPFFKRTGN